MGTNLYNNLFGPTISKKWNKLPSHVSDCASLHVFRSTLDNLMYLFVQ